MRKSKKVGMVAVVMALTGYGAWALYKKYNSCFMNDVDEACCCMDKDVINSIDDMM